MAISPASGDSLWIGREANHDRVSGPPPRLDEIHHAASAGGILIQNQPLLPEATADLDTPNFPRLSLIPTDHIDPTLRDVLTISEQTDGLVVNSLHPTVPSTVVRPDEVRVDSLLRNVKQGPEDNRSRDTPLKSNTTRIVIEAPKYLKAYEVAAALNNSLDDELYPVNALLDK